MKRKQGRKTGWVFVNWTRLEIFGTCGQSSHHLLQPLLIALVDFCLLKDLILNLQRSLGILEISLASEKWCPWKFPIKTTTWKSPKCSGVSSHENHWTSPKFPWKFPWMSWRCSIFSLALLWISSVHGRRPQRPWPKDDNNVFTSLRSCDSSDVIPRVFHEQVFHKHQKWSTFSKTKCYFQQVHFENTWLFQLREIYCMIYFRHTKISSVAHVFIYQV